MTRLCPRVCLVSVVLSALVFFLINTAWVRRGVNSRQPDVQSLGGSVRYPEGWSLQNNGCRHDKIPEDAGRPPEVGDRRTELAERTPEVASPNRHRVTSKTSPSDRRPEVCMGYDKGVKHPTLDPKVEEKLRDYFRPLNQRFYRAIGYDFGWR